LRVLTWNVGTLSPLGFRLRNDLIERVAEEIASAAPDVVALQEVHDEGQIDVLRGALARRGLSYDATSQILAPELPDLRSVFLFRPDEREVLASSQCETSTGFVVHAVRVRGATVVNVHAPPRSPSGRRAVLGELAAWTSTLPSPVVVAGDFNLDPDAGLVFSLPTGGDPAADKQTFASLSETFPVGTTAGPTTAYGARVDHVRASRGVVVAEHVNRGARRLPMDHDPVLAELCLHVATATKACERCLAP
jgi:endonuclease/exonuclease/phosphatase family metal-dependent hydrolase